MSKNDYETLLAEIEAIDGKNVPSPSIPVAVALQEAEDLTQWCVPDVDLLVKAGLDLNFVKVLPGRIGALRYIQSLWQVEYKSLEDVQKEWAKHAVTGYDLRDELLHNFLHAYRKIPDLLAKAQKIAEGSGHVDMIQDLSDLAQLGKANQEPLKKVNMNLEMLDSAADMSGFLSNLLAKANGEKNLDNKTKLLRDKAFFHMKEAVDEIRQHGQYVFYRDESRHKGYVSHYRKRKSAAKAANTAKV